MNLRLLEIFRAVMQSQTTTGAAKFLQISQPAVSAAIKQLESQLEFPLFDRVGNRIHPTEEAKILFRESEPIFLLSKSLNKTAADLKEHKLGSLRIMATPQLGHTIVPKAIHELIKDRPKIKINLDVRRSYNVIEAVQNGAADVGLAIALENDLKHSLNIMQIATVDMVCLMQSNHPLAKQKSLTPNILSTHPIIGLEMGARLGPLIYKAFRDAGVQYRTTIDVRYSETACLLAKEGAGIAIVDRMSAITQLKTNDNLRILTFSPKIKVNVSAVYPKDRTISYLAQSFVQITKKLIKVHMNGN